jgi:hypothetical protein
MAGGMGGGMMGGGNMAGTITATGLELEPQGISGTVATAITSGGQTSFTLALPTGCAFSTLTGASNVTIYQQPKTVITTGSSIASGSTVHAFGLMFFDNGQWKMVASRLGSN